MKTERSIPSVQSVLSLLRRWTKPTCASRRSCTSATPFFLHITSSSGKDPVQSRFLSPSVMTTKISVEPHVEVYDSCFTLFCQLGTAFRALSKHDLHSTGLFWVGLNGTVVSIPHSEHLTCVSVDNRSRPVPLLVLHCLQCFGSLVNPFSRKNCCSPAENTNIAPQSEHKTSRSTKSMVPPADSKKARRWPTGLR